MKKYCLLLAIICVFFSACTGNKKKPQEVVSKERSETVRTLKLEKSIVSHYVDFSATLEGYEHINIIPSISGRISKIYVEIGDAVREGADLVKMDPNQYNTAKLNYNNIKNEMDRVEALIKMGSISQQVYDQTKLQLNQAQETLSFLEKNTFIKAPFSGVISSKNYEDSEMFTNMPIVTITQIRTLKAMINIPETYYNLVKKGMKVDIKSEIFKDKNFTGAIELISPTIDPVTHTFQAKVKIPNNNQELRPGMYTSIGLSLGETEAFIVPYSSVLKVQGSNDRYVYVDDNGFAKRINVNLGQRFDDKIEIYSAEPMDGYNLVIEGQGKLVNGIKLIVK